MFPPLFVRAYVWCATRRGAIAFSIVTALLVVTLLVTLPTLVITY